MIVWNGEDFIERSLRAILPFVREAQVMDTGSDDKTIEILIKLQDEFRRLEIERVNVQHLGKLWSNSEKDQALTSLLNRLKRKTRAEWILKVDDDEIFPDFLMEEIIDLEPVESYYAIPWYQVCGEDADKTLNPYYVRRLSVLRLFKNIQEIAWNGQYGRETIAYNGVRIPARKCQSFQYRFLHLGEYRKRFKESKHDYNYYKNKYGTPRDNLYIPLPEEYRKYVKDIKKPDVPVKN